LTDCKIGEAIERAPVQPNDVILGDRNFCSRRGIRSAAQRGAHVLMRMRWGHARMEDAEGHDFRALRRLQKLRVGEVGEWSVRLPTGSGADEVTARVVALRLPAPLAAKAERRVRRIAEKKGKKIDPRTIAAAHFVMLFTTVPVHLLDAEGVLALDRYRWQIEVAFKRLKQLLRLGNLPHKGGAAARSWILAKLLLALLIEKLYRSARSFFPWGYPIRAGRAAGS
jgi:hypothetical protein